MYFNIFFGFFIFLKNFHSRSAQLLLVFSVVTSAWCIASYISFFYKDLFELIWVVRASLFLGILQGLSIYSLVKTFPSEKLYFSWVEKVFFLPGYLLILIFCLTPFFLAGVSVTDVGIVTMPGQFIFLFGAASIFIIISSVYILVKKIQNNRKKIDLKLLLLAVVVMFSSIILFNFILPTFFNNINFVGYSPVFSLLFVVFAFYGILKQQSFDVKTILTETLVYIFWSVLLLFIFTQSNNFERGMTMLLFIFSVILGLFLIKSVKKEIALKEKAILFAKTISDQNKKIQSQKKTLEEMVRAKDEVMHIVTHQVNTPLSIIKSANQMYKDNLWDKEKFVKVLGNEVERLSTTLAEFLLAKKVGVEKVGMKLAEVDLVTLVEKIIEEKKLLKKVRLENIKINFEKFADVVSINLDVGKMTEVISNLLENAIDYSKDNILVKLEKENGKILFSVQDSGIGISKEESGKLFSRFVRLENAQKVRPDGTGLGLYVCKQIVEAHGGKIWVESEGLGRGATFKILFA